MNLQNKRIPSLDLLRGFAILGILAMNIVIFAMPEPAYLNVNWQMSASSQDKIIYALQFLFAREKFITLLCILFGAGLVVLWQRTQQHGKSSVLLIKKRLEWLFVFGIAHMTLLFYGDVLISYAISGFLIIQFIPDSPAKLMRRGVMLFSIGALIMLALAGLTTLDFDENMPISMLGYPYDAEQAKAVINLAVGDFSTMVKYNLNLGLELLFFMPVLFFALAGPMLIGMSLIKSGFFVVINESKNSDVGFSVKAELWLFTIGLVLSAIQIYFILITDFLNDFWLISPLNTVGSLLIVLAVASRLIKTVVKSPTWLMPIQYVGRMAFSLYILQSLIMTLIFRVWLADYFGLWSMFDLFGIVIIATVLQITLAFWWQRKIGQGPLERVWRYLTNRIA